MGDGISIHLEVSADQAEQCTDAEREKVSGIIFSINKENKTKLQTGCRSVKAGKCCISTMKDSEKLFCKQRATIDCHTFRRTRSVKD